MGKAKCDTGIRLGSIQFVRFDINKVKAPVNRFPSMQKTKFEVWAEELPNLLKKKLHYSIGAIFPKKGVKK